MIQNQQKKCTLFQVWVKLNIEILGLCDEPFRHYLLVERINPEKVPALKHTEMGRSGYVMLL